MNQGLYHWKCILQSIHVAGLHQKNMGEVTNAENIKADTPKILRPTHFSGPKDIKAEKWVVGVVPLNFFFSNRSCRR